MAKYRKKPVVVDAFQWFENGDHPEDGRETFKDEEGHDFLGEGKIVRYFRRPGAPGVPGDTICEECGKTFHVHGWIDTLEDGHRVCPGDFIITGVEGWPP